MDFTTVEKESHECPGGDGCLYLEQPLNSDQSIQESLHLWQNFSAPQGLPYPLLPTPSLTPPLFLCANKQKWNTLSVSLPHLITQTMPQKKKKTTSKRVHRGWSLIWRWALSGRETVRPGWSLLRINCRQPSPAKKKCTAPPSVQKRNLTTSRRRQNHWAHDQDAGEKKMTI